VTGGGAVIAAVRSLPAALARQLLEDRCSARAPYDSNRPVTRDELGYVIDAARWAPTTHNIQNFMLVVVDDPHVLAARSARWCRRRSSRRTISSCRIQRATTRSPHRHPRHAVPAVVADRRSGGGAPRRVTRVVGGDRWRADRDRLLFDPTVRAPASEHDVLGMISLGCVLENMWLAAHASRLDVQVASAFAGDTTEPQVKRMLAVPEPWRIAFALRLGHAVAPADQQHRVRRLAAEFVHHNRFAKRLP
jgi:nitroreductase